VPVSLTEFECTFTLRLIFAPLLGVFPCFGALTIALMDEPQLDFDLRVVGGDVTLVPGLKVPLRSYIKVRLVPIRPRWRGERRSLRTFPGVTLHPHLAFNPRPRRLSTPTDAFQLHPDIKALIASWMVWPRCITVAIPGTGYALPSESEREKPHTGLLHIQVVSHDGRAISPGEVGLQVRWPVADLLVAKNQEETRVKALPGGGVLSSKEITLPVEDPRAQLLCVRWYTREVRDEETGVVVTPERLDGEASVVLDELMRQAVSSSSSSVGGGAEGLEADVAIAQWGPVPVAAELEPPIGADIKSVGGAKGGGKRGGGWFGRAAGAVTGVVSKSASGVVAGYKARSPSHWSPYDRVGVVNADP